MRQSEVYEGDYIYKGQKTAIEVLNDFSSLTLFIEGIEFKGTEFSDLELVDKTLVDSLDKDLFLLDAYHCLSNCIFKLNFPQRLVHNGGKEEVIVMTLVYTLMNDALNMALNKEEMVLSFDFNGVEYKGDGGCFESAFVQINKQLKGEFYFKNCFGCLYGDYSCYGNSSFGTMYCFRKSKEQYKAIEDKTAYLNLWDAFPPIRVQEIACCNEFEKRVEGVGYR